MTFEFPLFIAVCFILSAIFFVVFGFVEAIDRLWDKWDRRKANCKKFNDDTVVIGYHYPEVKNNDADKDTRPL